MKRTVWFGVVVALLPSASQAQQTTPGVWGAPPPQVVALPPQVVPPPPPEARGDSLALVPRARHALYVTGTTLILVNAAGITYSFRPIRALAISVGGGVSGAFFGFAAASAVGGQLMVHGLFGGASSHSFEGAAGISVIETDATLFCSGCSSSSRVAAMPAAFLGYRYHPLDGGFLFRAGAAWDYGLGIGASVSFGGAF